MVIDYNTKIFELGCRNNWSVVKNEEKRIKIKTRKLDRGERDGFSFIRL